MADKFAEHCRLANRILKKDVVCGKNCPLFADCPKIILEDATDKAIEQATDALVKKLQEYW